MQANQRFVGLEKTFWANVRTISQAAGYTHRGTRQIKRHSVPDMMATMLALGLGTKHLYGSRRRGPTGLAKILEDYFDYRAEILNEYVEPRLMDAERAREVFEATRAELNPKWPVPMNKQAGDKKAPAYLTGLVNMLVEANCEASDCAYDPRGLTTITRDDAPLRTLARRVDGCFPSIVNPVAVWEIKEYYYTTTFGSRIADGVYESLLDGLELEELREHEGIHVQHLLIVDSHRTWWIGGRSYLCRLVDMLHMGYVDEVLFGYEVVERLPEIVANWIRILRERDTIRRRPRRGS